MHSTEYTESVLKKVEVEVVVVVSQYNKNLPALTMFCVLVRIFYSSYDQPVRDDFVLI